RPRHASRITPAFQRSTGPVDLTLLGRSVEGIHRDRAAVPAPGFVVETSLFADPPQLRPVGNLVLVPGRADADDQVIDLVGPPDPVHMSIGAGDVPLSRSAWASYIGETRAEGSALGASRNCLIERVGTRIRRRSDARTPPVRRLSDRPASPEPGRDGTGGDPARAPVRRPARTPARR